MPELHGIQVSLKTEFQCPRCNSNEWGTGNATEAFEKWVGSCHQCSFEWPRTEDWKHFIVVVQASESDKQALYRAVHGLDRA